MDDERVETWAAFGGVDASDGRTIAGVCTEAIDCFCRQCDTLARAQKGGSLCDTSSVGGKKMGG
jgi:hypothetical protein